MVPTQTPDRQSRLVDCILYQNADDNHSSPLPARTLNILVVGEHNVDDSGLATGLNDRKTYRLIPALSIRDAEEYIETGERVHACILGVGPRDRSMEAMKLVQCYAREFPVLLLVNRGKEDMCRIVSRATLLGARAAFESTSESLSGLFHRVLDTYTLASVIDPWFCKRSAGDPVRQALDILFSFAPATITAWA
ncbi:MAG: hypothetical protein GF344_15720 [Chitinivibrionales bacterium]|nr:hypothetical protein [Chitinivibrionales bacterium]MBD3358149.1 hypothetical protein [Chitinivibrionales bacterium]